MEARLNVRKALVKTRWPKGFCCPKCKHTDHCVLPSKKTTYIPVQRLSPPDLLDCRDIVSGNKLTVDGLWFLAIYFISQAKTGLSALALKRHLGVSYPTAWLMQHKLMQAMAEREDHYLLSGHVQMDDAYLGGERRGGKAGRGSENKTPFVAAVSVDDEGHPLRVKLTPVSGFTLKAITDWSKNHLSSDCTVLSDGLACFNGVSDAGFQHTAVITGGRKPNELPEFNWVNTVLGNVKTSLNGAYHAFDFSKYAHRYLAAIAYRFNRRFILKTLPERLLIAAVGTEPRTEAWLRLAEDPC